MLLFELCTYVIVSYLSHNKELCERLGEAFSGTRKRYRLPYPLSVFR